jgi:hypothetical protein
MTTVGLSSFSSSFHRYFWYFKCSGRNLVPLQAIEISAVTAVAHLQKRISKFCNFDNLFWPFARTPFKLSPPSVFELASKTMRHGVFNDPSL